MKTKEAAQTVWLKHKLGYAKYENGNAKGISAI